MKNISENITTSFSEIPGYREKTYLLAVSGGADSMVLLHVFHSLKLRFKVAHCNFNLRGADSLQDEKLVESQSRIYEVDYFCESFDVKRHKKSNKTSTQMAARDLRYSFFRKTMKEQNLDFLVTAHHLDDNIETVFLNLVRGTGIKGLTGMNVLSDTIFRPLLSVSKKDILAYAQLHKVTYRNDASNKSNDYSRNKIRNLVIPILEELNPSFGETMSGNISNLRVMNEVYQTAMDKHRKELVSKKSPDKYEVRVIQLSELKTPKNFLFEWLSDFGFNFDTVDQLWMALAGNEKTGKQFLSNSHRILIDRKKIILSPLNNLEINPIFITKKVTNVTNPVRLSISSHPKNEWEIRKEKSYGYLDEDKLLFPLELRKWKEGDVFQPFGMKGKKKISDYLIDNKVSQFQKEETYVLLSGEEIVWLVGHRTSEKYRVLTSTKTVLTLKLNEAL